mgnify:CR=1 FL=1
MGWLDSSSCSRRENRYIIGTLAGAAVTAIMVNTMKKPVSELKEAIEAEKEEEELELELDFD